MNVFLIEKPRGAINLTTAQDFGEVRVLFPPEEHRTSVFNVDAFGEEVVSRLKRVNFDKTTDSICVAGSMITVIVAIAAILKEWGQIRVLFFNAAIDHYVQRTLNG